MGQVDNSHPWRILVVHRKIFFFLFFIQTTGIYYNNRFYNYLGEKVTNMYSVPTVYHIVVCLMSYYYYCIILCNKYCIFVIIQIYVFWASFQGSTRFLDEIKEIPIIYLTYIWKVSHVAGYVHFMISIVFILINDFFWICS